MKEAGLSYQKPRRTAAEVEAEDREEFDNELKKAAGDRRHNSLHRPDEEIGPGRAACRVVSAWHAALRRIIWTTRLDVSIGRDHRSR